MDWKTIVLLLVVATMSLILFVLIVYDIYQKSFFKSEKFSHIRKSVRKLVTEHNLCKRHIEKLKLSRVGMCKLTYSPYWRGKSKRYPEFQGKYVFECSESVCKSAQQEPFAAICKYFNIQMNKETLRKYETMFNNFEAVDDGTKMLENMKNRILSKVIPQVPAIIFRFSKKKLLRELRVNTSEGISNYFPIYVFKCANDDWLKTISVEIVLNPNTLEELIQYIHKHLDKKSEVSKAIMSRSLRESTKRNDGFKCRMCGASLSKNPYLLLEVQEEKRKDDKRVWQTVCWKCSTKHYRREQKKES